MEHLSDEVRAALACDLTIDITTTGRKSGAQRRIEIWFLNIDGRIFITGTPRPRDWLANLTAEPNFTFHLKESVVADLAARAEVIHDHKLRQRVAESAAAAWYLERSSVEEMVNSAPIVEVTFPSTS